MQIRGAFRILFFTMALAISSGQSIAATEFYYTSSPRSWVGAGETVSVTPDMGFEFSPYRNYGNGVSFTINDFATNAVLQNTRRWYLDFAAPLNAPLSAGEYSGATRFPFQSAQTPGLTFAGNGRGNNTLTGSFEVLEISYTEAGAVLTFAADFVQYDEGVQTWWNIGSIRYNSSIPILAVPEPTTAMLLCCGLAAITIVVRRRNVGSPSC